MNDVDSEGYCFQLIEQGVAFPPILVKAELLPAIESHGASLASQSIRYSALRFQAIRFLNGKQELVQVDFGGDDSSAFVKAVAGKKGLNKRLSTSECCEEVYLRFKRRQFERVYDKEDSRLKITFREFKGLDTSFDFVSELKRSPATPAFVLAFEAACSFGKAIQIAEETSSQASIELKQKARELTLAERKASNLSEDLAREKQKFQRLLTSGGSSLEDALASRASRGGRRNASLLADDSILPHDPDSPRKRRKAADGVLLKAGRTAQKETKKGFIDSSSDEEEDEDENRDDEPAASRKTKGTHRPNSSDTTASSSVASKASGTNRTQAKSLQSAKRQKAKLIEEPTLNAKRSVRANNHAMTSGFVESDTDEGEEAEPSTSAAKVTTIGGKSKGRQAERDTKAARSDTESEKTASDS